MALFFKRRPSARQTYSNPSIRHPYMDRCEIDPYFANVIDNCRELRTNLVIADYIAACSAEEAKYRGRVFCIDGTDKRYPYLSEEAIQFCHGFSPFIHGVSLAFDIRGKEYDPIKFSNRPFTDDRTATEKRNYNLWLQEREKEEKNRQEYLKNKQDYEWICANLPDLAPKSQSGYTRMLHSGSDKFQTLRERAKELGYYI